MIETQRAQLAEKSLSVATRSAARSTHSAGRTVRSQKRIFTMLFLLELFLLLFAIINFSKVEIASYLSGVAAGTQQRLQTGGNCGHQTNRGERKNASAKTIENKERGSAEEKE